MIRHHPDDSLLLAHAAGSLDAGSALLMAIHLEACAACRVQLAFDERLGGVLLERIEPQPLAVEAFSRTLARLDGAGSAALARAPLAAAAVRRPALPVAASARAGAAARPALPAELQWPAAMAGCTVSPWHLIGPQMRWSRVGLPDDPAARVFLLRMGAGRELAMHTHSGAELTQVLYGAFDDGRATWQAGDLDATDESVHHRPVVTADGECICLVALQGRVRFHGMLASALGAWMGL